MYKGIIADIADKLGPLADGLLAPGEQLLGHCVATRAGVFSSAVTGVFVTPERLIVQELTRRFEPKGEPLSLTPGQIADASAGGAGDDWYNVYPSLMQNAAVQLKLKTTDGKKLKLMMMRGEGPIMGPLGGGETQRQGVQAIGEWFRDHATA